MSSFFKLVCKQVYPKTCRNVIMQGRCVMRMLQYHVSLHDRNSPGKCASG